MDTVLPPTCNAPTHHAHSYSCETPIVPAEMGSPRLHSSWSASPLPSQTCLLTSVSLLTEGSDASITSLQHGRGEISAEPTVLTIWEWERSKLKTTLPISPTGHTSSALRYLVLLFLCLCRHLESLLHHRSDARGWRWKIRLFAVRVLD